MLTNETVNGKKYKYGLNKSKEPFEFYDTDLFISLNKPVMWVREVEIPKGINVNQQYLDDYNDSYVKYSSNEVILKTKNPLTLEIIKNLINNNVDVSVGNYNILHWAIVNDHYKIFKELIKYVNIYEPAMNQLYISACSRGKIPTIKHLLNIDKNLINNFSGIYYACLKNQINVIKFLIKNGFKGNNKSLIKIAKEKDYIKLINLLDNIDKEEEELICDHCKQPIYKNGFHITIEKINNKDDINEGYYHQTCVIPAVELSVIKNYCSETKG
jgi:hypothetical protein